MKRFIFIIFQLLLAYSWGEFTDDAPNRDPETFELKYNDSLFCDLSYQHLLCRRGNDEATAFNPLKGEIAEDCANKDQEIFYFPDSIAEREYILEYFNNMRSKVAKGTYAFDSDKVKDISLPSATDMRALRWDYLCEQVALNRVKYCEPIVAEEPCGIYNFYIYEINIRSASISEANFESLPTHSDSYESFWEKALDMLFSGFQYEGKTPEEIIKIDSEYISTSINGPMLDVILNSEASVLGVKAALREQDKELAVDFVMGGFTKWKESSVYEQGDATCSNCKDGSTCNDTSGLCECPTDFSCFNNKSDANSCYDNGYNILNGDCPPALLNSDVDIDLLVALDFLDNSLSEKEKLRYFNIISQQPLKRPVFCPDWNRVRIEHLKKVLSESQGNETCKDCGPGEVSNTSTTFEPTEETDSVSNTTELTDTTTTAEGDTENDSDDAGSKCPNMKTLNGMLALYMQFTVCIVLKITTV